MAAESFLEISELFYSIQGESSFAGYPCVFIRLSGCNLSCAYCDTKYSWQEPGKSYGVNDLFDFVDKYPCSLVEITGGEPLLQPAVYLLMDCLLKAGKTVLMETNGSINIRDVPPEVIKIMDIKTPDSGMVDKINAANMSLLSPHDEIKFVLCSRRDYDWAVNFVKTHFITPDRENMKTKFPIIFSPVVKQLEPRRLAQWILADRLPVRLQLQLHTIIWPDRDRGM